MILRGALAAKGAALLAVAVVASAVAWNVTGNGGSPVDALGGSLAWIDAPLDGSTIDHGMVEVVAHVHDRDGVSNVTLSVDGEDLSSGGGTGETLVTVSFEWDATAAAEGSHELRIAGVDTGGDATAVTTATVHLAGDAPADGEGEQTPGSTTTTVLSDTSTSSSTSTSSTSSTSSSSTSTTSASSSSTTTTTSPRRTTTTTSPRRTTTTTTTTTTRRTTTTTTTTAPRVCAGVAAPQLLTPEDGSRPGTRTPTFTWAYDHCDPERFVLQISMEHDFAEVWDEAVIAGTARSFQFPNQLDCGIWYWRLQAQNRGAVSAWSEPFEMELNARVC